MSRRPICPSIPPPISLLISSDAGVADLDGDGRLELLISHGESASEPLTLYTPNLGTPGVQRSYVARVLMRVCVFQIYMCV